MGEDVDGPPSRTMTGWGDACPKRSGYFWVQPCLGAYGALPRTPPGGLASWTSTVVHRHAGA